MGAVKDGKGRFAPRVQGGGGKDSVEGGDKPEGGGGDTGLSDPEGVSEGEAKEPEVEAGQMSVDSERVAVLTERIKVLESTIEELKKAAAAGTDVPLSEVQEGIRWEGRSDEPWIYREALSFAEDSGYDSNMLSRATGILHRGFGLGKDNVARALGTSHPVKQKGSDQMQMVWKWDKLPRFSPNNRIQVTLEFIEGPLPPDSNA